MHRCPYLIILMLLSCTAVLAADRTLTIVSCPQFLVPGHAKPIVYCWQGKKAQMGMPAVFRLAVNGALVARPSATVAIHRGGGE